MFDQYNDLFACNPFTDAYVREEVAFYGGEDYEAGGVEVDVVSPRGRMDDYLNVNFRMGEVTFPRLRIGGDLWMSLSPMEVQSHFLPILFAEGDVGVGGLGLGYYTLRVMAKKNVDSVTVFESNPRIIEYFKSRFKDREGFSKVVCVKGDARGTMVGYTFDFVFMDIYPTLCGGDMVKDIKLFNERNQIGEYAPWGREKVLLEGRIAGLVDWVDLQTQHYFSTWAKTSTGDQGMDTKLSNMFERSLDSAYIKHYLEAIEDFIG